MGFRSVTMRNWVMSVNGERLFLKGANHGPTRMALGEASSDEVARDVHLAIDAGLDLFRVHAHVARPELYDAADEAGLLLWQEMPLQWGYARSVRKQAIRQARKAVDLLGHHPSIVLWCGHNVPVAVDVEPSATMDPRKLTLEVRGRAAAADVQPQHPRPLGEARVRARRSHPSRHRALWCAPPPPEARRHRHARVLRVVHRSRARLPAVLRDACRAWRGS